MSSCLFSFHMDFCFTTANCSGVTPGSAHLFGWAGLGLMWDITEGTLQRASQFGDFGNFSDFRPFDSLDWLDCTEASFLGKDHLVHKLPTHNLHTMQLSKRKEHQTACHSNFNWTKNYACPCSLTVPGLNLVCGKGCAHIIFQIQNLNDFWRFCQAPHLDAGWEASSGGIWRVFRFSKHTFQHFQLQNASSLWTLLNILDL